MLANEEDIRICYRAGLKKIPNPRTLRDIKGKAQQDT